MCSFAKARSPDNIFARYMHTFSNSEVMRCEGARSVHL